MKELIYAIAVYTFIIFTANFQVAKPTGEAFPDEWYEDVYTIYNNPCEENNND